MKINLMIAYSMIHSTQWILGDESKWSYVILKNINYDPEDWILSFTEKGKDREFYDFQIYEETILSLYLKTGDADKLFYYLHTDNQIFLSDLKAINDGI